MTRNKITFKGYCLKSPEVIIYSNVLYRVLGRFDDHTDAKKFRSGASKLMIKASDITREMHYDGRVADVLMIEGPCSSLVAGCRYLVGLLLVSEFGCFDVTKLFRGSCI